MDIEIEGVKQIKKSHLNPIYVFIEPPSIGELERRLKGRNTETEESLKKRLDTAKSEIEYGIYLMKLIFKNMFKLKINEILRLYSRKF